MNRNVVFSALLSLSVLLPALAQEEAAAPAKKPRRMHPMAVAMANPAAWVEPEHFIALVNEGDAIDAEWLKGFVPGLIRYCQLRMEIVSIEAKDDASPAALLARAKEAAGEKAKAFIVFSGDLEEPVVTAPGSGWAIMNPAWVRTDAEADAEKTNERMGKQVYRALGLAFGAGFRLEPEAVLRDAPTPQSLDEALSKNLHPQNVAILQAVAKRMGIEQRKLKSREELVALGILPPPKPKAAPAEAPAAPKAE